MNVSEYREKAIAYGRAHRMLPWMIGDLLNQFSDDRGDEFWQYAEDVGLSRDVLRDYMFVAEIFDEQNRYDYRLSIYYFREVATLPGAVAHGLLLEAIEHGWSSKDLRAHARLYRERRENTVRFPKLGPAPILPCGEVQDGTKEAAAEGGGEEHTQGSQPLGNGKR